MKKLWFVLICIFVLQSCNLINKNQYNIAYPFKEEEKDRWGLIDVNGNILIANEWENEPSISIDGIVLVRNNKGFCEFWTAEEKTKQIGDEYINALPFREDLAAVISKDSICEYIDKEGKVMLSLNKLEGKKVISITLFSEGKAAFKNEDNKWGYIDKKGNVVIKPVYDAISDFKNDIAIVVINNQNTDTHTYYWIDKNNKPIEKFPDGYEFRNCVGENYIYSDDKGKNWGIMNNKAEKLLRPSEKYKDLATSLNKDYFSFTDGDKTGIINLKGEVVVRAKYNTIFFTDNYFLVDDNGKAGFLDIKGDEVIKPTYDNARPMFNNKAYVKDRNRWILIDNKGKDILKKDFYIITSGSDNLYTLGNYLISAVKKIDVPQRPAVALNYNNQTNTYSYNGTIKLTTGDINLRCNISVDNNQNISGYYTVDGSDSQIPISGAIEVGGEDGAGHNSSWSIMKFTAYNAGQASDRFEVSFGSEDYDYNSGAGTWYSADGQRQANFNMTKTGVN